MGDFFHKVFHDDILFVELDKDVEEVFVIALRIVISDFMLDLLKGSFYFSLFFQTLFILLLNFPIFFFLDFDVRLVFLYLLFELFQMLPLDFFGLDKLFEPEVVLDLVVQLLALLLELLLPDFGLFF